jgi:hypothetical protein
MVSVHLAQRNGGVAPLRHPNCKRVKEQGVRPPKSVHPVNRIEWPSFVLNYPHSDGERCQQGGLSPDARQSDLLGPQNLLSSLWGAGNLAMGAAALETIFRVPR